MLVLVQYYSRCLVACGGPTQNKPDSVLTRTPRLGRIFAAIGAMTSAVADEFAQTLDKSIDNKALQDIFSGFGTIVSSKVALDRAGDSRGYGYVHYELHESAQLAIEKVGQFLLSLPQASILYSVKLTCFLT